MNTKENGSVTCGCIKKSGQPYIGFVDGNHIEHTDLIAEKRSRMKIILFDPTEDLPIDTIQLILGLAIKVKG